MTCSLATLRPETPSIFITYVHPKTTPHHISSAIRSLWGVPSSVTVLRRDMLHRTQKAKDVITLDGAGVVIEDYGSGDEILAENAGPGKAIVHMHGWYGYAMAQDARVKLLQEEYVKLFINPGAADSFFYGCVVYKNRV